MQMRRMTRLTNAFSKKWDNLWSAYCLWFAFYNFCRIHTTIRVTPAMEAGLTDHVWDLKELLAELVVESETAGPPPQRASELGLGYRSQNHFKRSVYLNASPATVHMARKKKRSDAWVIAALWVCLMSGAFSILREWLATFMPTFAAPTRIFQACAVTCAVISGWLFMYRQSARIRELERISPSEERYIKMVQDPITLHGQLVVVLLRHMKLMGEIVFAVRTAPNLPEGMNYSQTVELLKVLKTENIVYDEATEYDTSSPLARMRESSVWRISPGIEPILDEVL